MIVQQLLNGLISGSVYALFALGFTLIFGTHRILNLAHAGVFMTGAFIGYYCVVLGLPLWLAIVLAMIGSGLLSYFIDIVAFQQLRAQKQIEFAALISSIGANLILINIAQRLSDTQVLSFPFGTFPTIFFHFAGVRVSALQLMIVALVAVLFGLLLFYLYKTSFGRQVRAVAGNERAAMLLGVNPKSVYFQTFFISGALAGIAGVLIGLLFSSVYFLMGEPYLLRGFVIVILGGLGSIPGAVVAGLLLGVMQTLATAYLPPGLTDAMIYSLLFVGLLIRPSGLFGGQAIAVAAGRR
ncbi:MAG: branched-chain amino acid ABC transporter permease [Rhizobiaceae bacterium]